MHPFPRGKKNPYCPIVFPLKSATNSYSFIEERDQGRNICPGIDHCCGMWCLLPGLRISHRFPIRRFQLPEHEEIAAFCLCNCFEDLGLDFNLSRAIYLGESQEKKGKKMWLMDMQRASQRRFPWNKQGMTWT